MHSQVGQALWNWVQNVAFPEEIFFNTVIRIDKKMPLLSFNNGSSFHVKQSNSILKYIFFKHRIMKEIFQIPIKNVITPTVSALEGPCGISIEETVMEL